MGLITPRNNRFAMRLTERIEDLVMIILVPLYFTYSGLRSNLSSINSWQAGVTLLLAIVVSMVGKIGGGTIASRIMRYSWRESLTIGFLLNTKGLVELVALNVGVDIGVLTNQVFSAFVVMALWNTIITSPVVWLLTRKEKKAYSISESTDYSVLVCIQDPKVGISMVTFAGTLAKSHAKSIESKQKPCINAVHLKKVSERLSTYIFNLRLGKLDAVEFARQRALVLNVDLKTVARSSVNIPADLTKIANSRVPSHLVILGCNKHHPDYFVGRKVEYFMQHINAPIGIFVDKGRLRDQASVEHVLLVYSFQPFEMEAAKVALKMASNPDVHVTIIIPIQEKLMSPCGSNRQAVTSNSVSSRRSQNRTQVRSHKKIMWHQYFDILFLFSCLIRFIKHCMPKRSDGDGNTKATVTTPSENYGDVEMEEKGRESGSSSSSRKEQSIGLSPSKSTVTELSTADSATPTSKTTEEQMMQSFEGIQALVHTKANLSLVLSEDLLQETLEQEATHAYQIIIIGNQRKWSQAHQLYPLDHYSPPNLCDNNEEERETCYEDRKRLLNELANLSATSLLVVHPPLPLDEQSRSVQNCFGHPREKEDENENENEDEDEDEDEEDTSVSSIEN